VVRTVIMAFDVWLDCKTCAESDAGCATKRQTGKLVGIIAERNQMK